MDFIPLPDNVTSHVSVPALVGPAYDNCGFTGYDVRQGWNFRNLRLGRLAIARNDWDRYESVQSCYAQPALLEQYDTRILLAAAFIQTWTLYGIFHELLGRSIKREELLSPCIEGDLPKTISTRRAFGEFLSQKRRWAKDTSFVSRTMQFLVMARELIVGFARSPVLVSVSGALDNVFRSLLALNESISASLVIFSPSIDSTMRWKYYIDPFGQSLIDERGWCPNVIRILGKTASVYYASLVPGLFSRQPHNHCNRNQCVAFNVETGAYTTQHVFETCLCAKRLCSHPYTEDCCADIAMPAVAFHTALIDGTFPLVKLIGNELHVVKYIRGMSFVAISHPWSDGRGNPNCNSLPLCQLRAISSYAMASMSGGHSTSAESDCLFWMDTLCVPVDEPLRNSAILRMAEVYASSRITLVLAAELMFVNKPSSTHETLLRITCSKWSTRLWLLHEAGLARNLVFQFADGLVKHRDLFMKTLAAGVNPHDLGYLLTTDLNNSYMNSMTKIRPHGESEFCTLESLWSGLRFRTSSRLLDATICASILLGTDLAKVLDAPNGRKVQTFWACQARIPYNILFVDGMRLSTDGFHWAPSNLLDSEALSLPLAHMYDHEQKRYGKPTADGLVISGVEVFIIEIPEMRRGGFYGFRLKGHESLRSCYFWIDDTPGHPWHDVMNDLASDWDGSCAILLSNKAIGRAALVIPQKNVSQATNIVELTICRRARYAIPVELYDEDDSNIIKVPDYRRRDGDSYATVQEEDCLIDTYVTETVSSSQQWILF